MEFRKLWLNFSQIKKNSRISQKIESREKTLNNSFWTTIELWHMDRDKIPKISKDNTHSFHSKMIMKVINLEWLWNNVHSARNCYLKQTQRKAVRTKHDYTQMTKKHFGLNHYNIFKCSTSKGHSLHPGNCGQK